MRALLIICVLCICLALAPTGASAHQARFVHVEQHDITTIVDPDLSQAFYGELTDSPHLFEFHVISTQNIYAEILVPDIGGDMPTISGLIMKVEDRGVTEIRRLPAKDATWDSFYEWFGGDSYRHGVQFYDSLTPGTYQIEVSTPIDRGKYVLVVGKREDYSVLSYFQTIRDIAHIKNFFGKSSLAIVETPFVYIPLGLLGLGIACHVRKRKIMKQ